jgi:nicotinate phosphoribosyltransferase
MEASSTSALFTDLYGLTMAQAYDAEGMDGEAVFEVFFRELPSCRNYLVAAGLDDVLRFIEQLQFTGDDLEYLAGQRLFSARFLDRLRDLRFPGDVNAMAEGTPVFPGEPMLQIVAPIIQAQLLETMVLNQLHVQTVIASKAARVVDAAAGRPVVEFGARRAHGLDAALKLARTSYLAGAIGTSLVLAGKRYGIPIFGTMAHSYIQSHEEEEAALSAFAALYPDATLLVDTYDTLEGVRKVIDLCQRSKVGAACQAAPVVGAARQSAPTRVGGIRLDSGDLGELARQARRLLDDAGLQDVRIFASGDLDEYRVAELVGGGAPIDSFGVGTRLSVALDAPTVGMIYKLVEYAGRPRIKLSAHKETYPGRKQVFRTVEDGRIARDVIGRHDEALPGEPLLQPVMRAGKRLPAGRVSLEEARRHALRERRRLPEDLRRLDPARKSYSVEVSAALERELEAVRRRIPGGRT